MDKLEIKFTLYGEIFVKGAFYTKAENVKKQLPKIDIEKMEKRIYKVKIFFYFKPKSTHLNQLKRNTLIKTMYCNKGYDIDNCLKNYFDIFTGTFWKSDKKIVSVFTEKYYTLGKERIEVEIEVI